MYQVVIEHFVREIFVETFLFIIWIKVLTLRERVLLDVTKLIQYVLVIF